MEPLLATNSCKAYPDDTIVSCQRTASSFRINTSPSLCVHNHSLLVSRSSFTLARCIVTRLRSQRVAERAPDARHIHLIVIDSDWSWRHVSGATWMIYIPIEQSRLPVCCQPDRIKMQPPSTE